MIQHELFDNGSRRWVFFGRDPERGENLIDTNQYLVTQNGKGLLLDPGGVEIFPAMAAALAREISFTDIECIFASHQDPDVISSLGLWLDVCPDVEVVASWLWGGFIPHFGLGRAVVPIPDEGMKLPLGGCEELELIPAHYLHSSGNFHLYDPAAKILFTGDLGAALLPANHPELFVEDFEAHTEFMAGFHRRWLPSNRAKRVWVERASALDIEYLCPQHGTIFRGDDVRRFIAWLDGLEVGAAV
jgi:flavorubredoxin